jgi:hypothetical protein
MKSLPPGCVWLTAMWKDGFIYLSYRERVNNTHIYHELRFEIETLEVIQLTNILDILYAYWDPDHVEKFIDLLNRN